VLSQKNANALLTVIKDALSQKTAQGISHWAYFNHESHAPYAFVSRFPAWGREPFCQPIPSTNEVNPMSQNPVLSAADIRAELARRKISKAQLT